MSQLERLGPIDRTPGIPGSDKNWPPNPSLIIFLFQKDLFWTFPPRACDWILLPKGLQFMTLMIITSRMKRRNESTICMIIYLIGSKPKWMMIDDGNLLSCDIDVDGISMTLI